VDPMVIIHMGTAHMEVDLMAEEMIAWEDWEQT